MYVRLYGWFQLLNEPATVGKHPSTKFSLDISTLKVTFIENKAENNTCIKMLYLQYFFREDFLSL